MKKLFNGFWVDENKEIKDFVKTKKLTVYGSQAIRQQIGFISREPGDWDISSRTPKKHSRQLERRLDTRSRGNYYYSKPGVHPGVWKVQNIGADRKPNTKDDLQVADFSKPTRKMKTINKDGIKYVHLSETLRDKRASLKDRQYLFRHKKDRDDVQRIRWAMKMRKWRRII